MGLSVPSAVGSAIARGLVYILGSLLELLPGSAASAGAPVGEIAPVVAGAGGVGVVGGGGEQIMFGGMQETLSGACPDCGSQLEYAEGCVKCHVCGYSECG
jgi:ribonucleoside-diphosphate reductase alpha chain